MPDLPLKIKLAVRDHWSKADGPVQTALAELSKLLGHGIVVEPEWQLLVNELDSTYPDKERLVTTVAGTVEVWAKGMKELLDDPANEDWADAVVDKTSNAGGRLRIFLDVDSSADNCSTAWSETRGGFVISLINEYKMFPTELFPIFRGQLLDAFKPAAKKVAIPHRGADDWADVQMDTTTGAVDVVDKPAARAVAGATAPKAEYLPTLDTLPRPDELLLRPPYHLVVYAGGGSDVEVQGSHSPSLKLLADYLKRWCRVNHNDTRAPPGVQITLHQSAFGLGVMFDRVTISTDNSLYTTQFHVTAPIVLSFVEGVLGYDLVTTRPGTWNFRRDQAFKVL